MNNKRKMKKKNKKRKKYLSAQFLWRTTPRTTKCHDGVSADTCMSLEVVTCLLLIGFLFRG
jgi:hypothetical protein